MTGKKKTGRIKQLSLKSTLEFHQRLKNLANEEKCLMIEILEQALAVWEIQRQKDLVKKKTKENTVPQVSQEATPIGKTKRPFTEFLNGETETNVKKRKISE